MSMPTIVILSFLLSMASLLWPLFSSTFDHLHIYIKSAVKKAFFISLPPLLLLLNEDFDTAVISLKWLNIFSFPISMSLRLDQYTIMFIPAALLVSWSIIEYSLWYMHDDPKIQIFFKYLLTFLLAMMLLISAGDLLTLFIGWEGVGIMSYLLIGWHFSRSNTGVAALQAILYNRIGDIGFLCAIFWLMSSFNSVDLNFIFSTEPPTPLILAFIVAAASKSAQFGLHPWLASAMEGPTPVSALLHSSTMVVAGVFLLIRIHPLMKDNQFALTFCLCLGAISTAFAATCALTQNDIKKIIAFSTSSQLGLMMVAIGLNLPHLAFFHICTHAFFKAMLFLCSGSIIHNLNNEQDIRKMGGLQKILPITTSCLTTGSLALMGTPYLAGFFSKDAIIEAANTSYLNTWALLMTIIATSFTAVYSLRIVFFSSLYFPRFNPLTFSNENNPTAMNPIKRLALGTVIAGLVMYQIIIPTDSLVLTMPTHIKTSALIVSILGFIIAFDLAQASWTNTPCYNISKSINTSSFPFIFHRLIPTHLLNHSLQVASNLIDAFWLEKFGPKGLADSQLPPIMKYQEIQRGLIKAYLSVMSTSIVLSLFILRLV